jgi:hypothetical protein
MSHPVKLTNAATLASRPLCAGCGATTERSFDEAPMPLGDATALLMT